MKMKEKGFTLVELLTVFAILSIADNSLLISPVRLSDISR